MGLINITNIKTLYRNAKFGTSTDKSIYVEAVNELVNSAPNLYLTNLEYILSSGHGIETFKSFMDRYSIPLSGYRSLSEVCTVLVDKSKTNQLPTKPYQELLTLAESYLDKHQHLLAMFEEFEDKLPKDYFNLYYERIAANHLNVESLINQYGPGVIPDILVESIKHGGIDNIINTIANNITCNTPVIKQWVLESALDILPADTLILESIRSASLVATMDNIRDRSNKLIRESTILGESTYIIEYSDYELDVLREYLLFNEYMLTAVRTPASRDKILNIINEICDNYDIELDETTADITAFLPGKGNRIATEEAISHKKKGTVPSYISKHHSIANYGEDDIPPKQKNIDDDDDDQDVNDYKRKRKVTVDDDDEPESSSKSNTATTPNSNTTHNYYYHHYVNSFNKRTDSSVNKRTNSDNIRKTTVTNNNKKDDDDDDDTKKESFQIEYDEISSDVFNEGIGDAIKRIGSGIVKVAKRIRNVFFKKTRNNVHLMDLPENAFKLQHLVIPGTDIPIGSIKKGVPLKEANEIETNELELTSLDEFLESATIGRLTQAQIRNVCKRLQDKTNATVWISDGLVGTTFGPCMAVVSKDKLKSFMAGKHMPGEILTSNYEKVIVMSPKFISKFNIRSEKDVELIFLHEYGHYMTYDQLTERDWLEYTIAKTQLGGILNISLNSTDVTDFHSMAPKDKALLQICYYQYKVEKLANDYMNLNVDDLVLMTTGVPVPANFRSTPAYKFSQFPLPERIIEINRKAMKGSSPNKADLIFAIEWTKTTYSQLFTGDTLKTFLKSVDEQMAVIEEYYIESIDENNDIKEDSFNEYDNELLIERKINKSGIVPGPNKKLVQGERMQLSWWPRRQKKDTNDKVTIYDELGFEYIAGTDTETNIAKEFDKQIKKHYEPTQRMLFQEMVKLSKELPGYSMKALDVKADSTKKVNDIWGSHSVDEIFTYHFTQKYQFNDNLIFYGYPGSDLLFREFMGYRDSSNYPEYNVTNITNDSFRKFIAKYNIPHSTLKGIVTNSGEPKKELSTWTKLDWGNLAYAIFENYSSKKIIDAIKLSNIRLVKAYDDNTWDGLLGISVIYNDIDDFVKNFNKTLGDRGSVEVMKPSRKSSINENVVFESVDWIDDLNNIKLVDSSILLEADDDTSDDPIKPKSDHPIRDTIQDVDRVMSRTGGEIKRKANNVVNTGKVIAKPVNRLVGGIRNLINRFKDANETNIKEKMADPHGRKNLYEVIKKAIMAGALFKAGILLNPIFLFLAVTAKLYNNSQMTRIRNELTGELETELKVIDRKIEMAAADGNRAAEIQMTRFKNEIQKKLIRVAGNKATAKVI